MVAARHPSDVMEEWKDQIISNLPMKQQTQTQNIEIYRDLVRRCGCKHFFSEAFTACGIHVFEIHFRGARGYPMSSLSALQEREETDSQRAIGSQCNSTEALCPWWTCTCWLHPVIAVSSQPILGLCRASKLRSFCFESRSANYRPTKGRDTRSEHWPYGVRKVMCGGPIWNPVERCRKSHWSNGLNDISRNSR